MADMKSPEFQERFRQGPVGFLSVSPGGEISMAKSMIQWFVFSVLVSAAVAYLTGRTVGPGAEYFAVFRVAGTVAFLTYAGAQPMASIWEKRSWSTTWKHMLDGFLYGLVTAGCFAGFWPDA
jgi:nucleoside recognition membrane protein YjiH